MTGLEHPAAGARTETPAGAGAPGGAQEGPMAGLHRGRFHLLEAEGDAARLHLRGLARHLACPLSTVDADDLVAAPDAAAALRLALRDAVAVETRRLKRVFGGRIVRVQAHGDAEPGVPPARLEVDLETDEDRRSVRLEGAWAWNLHGLSLGPGDAVVIDPDHPHVTQAKWETVRHHRVQDEHDLRVRVTLGALDRVHTDEGPEGATAHGPGTTTGETDAATKGGPDDLLGRAARSRPRLLATAERPSTTGGARAATDAWVRRACADRHTRIVPGLLLVTRASHAPAPAHAALRSASRADAGATVVLCDAPGEAARRLAQIFPEALLLRPATATG